MALVIREHLPKKCLLSGIARMGGKALAQIKKYNIYIYLFIYFWRPKKMYKLPEKGEGGRERER